MSCNEHEAGTFKLPSKEFTRFKREFQRKWDTFVHHCYQRALSIHDSNPNIKTSKALEFFSEDSNGQLYNEEDYFAVEHFFIKSTQSGKMAKPKKYVINKLLFNTIMKREDGVFYMNSAFLIINSTDKTVKWQVDWGNHNVEHARKGILAQSLFPFLKTVQWTNKTGGEILYNNEYMQDGGPCSPQVRESYFYETPKQKEKRRKNNVNVPWLY